NRFALRPLGVDVHDANKQALCSECCQGPFLRAVGHVVCFPIVKGRHGSVCLPLTPHRCQHDNHHSDCPPYPIDIHCSKIREHTSAANSHFQVFMEFVRHFLQNNRSKSFG